MNITCKIVGHDPSGLILGFRELDGAALQKCNRCDEPIICKTLRASQPLMLTIIRGTEYEVEPTRGRIIGTAILANGKKIYRYES